ncbi:hypothetical protein XFF6970_390014 [Xanthomonas citri pv. fuscans]|nr:hypothetical protein XFF6970_390014 [Xanthomonas citri pv. fuscans]
MRVRRQTAARENPAVSRGKGTHQQAPARPPHAHPVLCATFSQGERTSLPSADTYFVHCAMTPVNQSR